MAKYAPEEMYRNALEFMAREQARLGPVNYSPYPGKTSAPMSTLTQRARELESRYGNKPLPYSNKIRNVLSRPERNFGAAEQAQLLNNVTANQNALVGGDVLGTLQKNFGTAYTDPRKARFLAKSNKDINRGAAEFGGRLQNLGDVTKNIEAQRNLMSAKTLESLQAAKQAKREGLIKNLYGFGNQRHTLENRKLDAQRAVFEDEKKWPLKRLQLLQNSMRPAGEALGSSDINPAIAESMGKQIAGSLRAYGVDPSKPADQWNSSNSGYRAYPGQLVAGATPEMQLSHDLLEQMSPKFRDEYYDQRKALMGNVMGNDSITSKALAGLPEAVKGEVAQLDQQAKDRLKKDIAVINNRYTQLGTYGSNPHMKEVEDRTREINKGVFDARNRIMESTLGKRLGAGQESEALNLQKLNMLGRQGVGSFGKIMKDVEDVNKRGSEKWRNQQDENEQLYKNYQNERDWEWPLLRNQVRSDAHREIFGNAAGRGIALDDIANIKARYSNVEAENRKLNESIKSERDYYDQKLKGYQNVENEQKRLEEQRRQEEAARYQAEQQRLAREAAERQRLASLQQSSFKPTTPGMYYIPSSKFNNYAQQQMNFLRSHQQMNPGTAASDDTAGRLKQLEQFTNTILPNSQLRGNVDISGNAGENYYPISNDSLGYLFGATDKNILNGGSHSFSPWRRRRGGNINLKHPRW